ncbi:MAG: DMT family transporter, partial [Acidimicrobiia bacterium]
AGVLLISWSGILVRLAGVEPARSAFLRMAYALPVLGLVGWWHQRRSPGARAGPAVLPLAVLAGLFLGVDLVAWHASVGIIGAGLGTIFPNLQVVFVGVVGRLVLGERPRRAFWMALPVIVFGVALLGFAGAGLEPGSTATAGIVYGLLSACFYSGYLILLRQARLRTPQAGVLQVVGSATLGAAASTGAFAVAAGAASPAGWPADGWLVVLALGCQVGGWVALASSIHRLPASSTSVTLLLQPVLALVWAAALLGEPFTPYQLAGAGIVLVGVAAAHRAVLAGSGRPVPSLEDAPAIL